MAKFIVEGTAEIIIHREVEADNFKEAIKKASEDSDGIWLEGSARLHKTLRVAAPDKIQYYSGTEWHSAWSKAKVRTIEE